MARKTISLDQLDGLSVDEETNQLYWHGKAVVTEMSLPYWVQLTLILASIATVISAVASVLALVLK